jgi:hypothetical protein
LLERLVVEIFQQRGERPTFTTSVHISDGCADEGRFAREREFPGFDFALPLADDFERQKALYVLRKRKLSREEMSAPELTVSMVEELGASITRTAYTRGAKGAHTVSSVSEVRQLKMWIDAVLGELLEIHAQSRVARSS